MYNTSYYIKQAYFYVTVLKVIDQLRLLYEYAIVCIYYIKEFFYLHMQVMLYSFLYSDIRWSHPEAQPSFLEIYTVNDNSDPRQVKIKSRQAGLIEHLMQKLKDLHQYDDRQVNLVFGTSGRRQIEVLFYFSVVHCMVVVFVLTTVI